MLEKIDAHASEDVSNAVRVDSVTQRGYVSDTALVFGCRPLRDRSCQKRHRFFRSSLAEILLNYVLHPVVAMRIKVLCFASILLIPHTLSAQYGIELAMPLVVREAGTGMTLVPDGSNRLFIPTQAGRILLAEVTPTNDVAQTVLDLTGSVFNNLREAGLLAVAFDPDFRMNGWFYVYYTTADTSGTIHSVLSRWTTDPDDLTAVDGASEHIILKLEQPTEAHNAGQIRFGPDGYLYLSLGDGGDRRSLALGAQDVNTVLGSLLRLDVSDRGGPPECVGEDAITIANYTIPPDNPFAGDAVDGCGEIYAYGLRNPWRFSFAPDGALYVADVGGLEREEINIIEKGGNYGWPHEEGTLCGPHDNVPCDLTNSDLIKPVWEYGHVDVREDTSGGNSITGGFVYQGTRCPDLVGKYVYSDHVTRHIWALQYDTITNTAVNELLVANAFVGGMPTFEEDADGELLLMSISYSTHTVWRVGFG